MFMDMNGRRSAVGNFFSSEEGYTFVDSVTPLGYDEKSLVSDLLPLRKPKISGPIA
jgi:hypothetical protein